MTLRHCLTSFAFAAMLVAGGPWRAAAADSRPAPPAAPTLRVAVVQLRSVRDLAANVAKIKQQLAASAARGAAVAVFPECAVSSYFPEAIKPLTPEALRDAEAQVAAACAAQHIAAIVGTPEKRDGQVRNCALIIDATGRIVARYYKIHLVGQDREWGCIDGGPLSPVFTIGGVACSVMICHDSRYPELCRLPVIAGARVVFYISHEAAVVKENKIGPYRAQVQARAVENRVYLVHANAPGDDLRTGSHGQSRIVNPDGNIVQEATQFDEALLIADLDLKEATAETALRSLENEPTGAWWREAARSVQIIK